MKPICATAVLILALFLPCGAYAGTEEQVKSNSDTTNAADVGGTSSSFGSQCANFAKSDVLVVLVFDDHCTKWCNIVKPIMHELGARHAGLKIIEIDASRKVLKDAKETAKKLKICNFLASSLEYVPMVGVFRKGALIEEIVGAKPKEVYDAAVQKALSRK